MRENHVSKHLHRLSFGVLWLVTGCGSALPIPDLFVRYEHRQQTLGRVDAHQISAGLSLPTSTPDVDLDLTPLSLTTPEPQP